MLIVASCVSLSNLIWFLDWTVLTKFRHGDSVASVSEVALLTEPKQWASYFLMLLNSEALFYYYSSRSEGADPVRFTGGYNNCLDLRTLYYNINYCNTIYTIQFCGLGFCDVNSHRCLRN